MAMLNNQMVYPIIIPSMAMQQEPIDWRYLPYLRPRRKGLNFREYPNISQQSMALYIYATSVAPLILEFPLINIDYINRSLKIQIV